MESLKELEKRRIDSLPPEYKPLSPWAYLGYNLLFVIPLIGLIFLFVFAFSNENINRRNYARSFFCVWLIAFIVVILAVLAFFAIGMVAGGF